VDNGSSPGAQGSGADTGDKVATNIRKGVLEGCVLALLARGERYGLELAEELGARGLSASAGSLYPLLARMRDAGLVETRWDSQTGARTRRYYAITPGGVEQLAVFVRTWREITPQVETLIEEER